MRAGTGTRLTAAVLLTGYCAVIARLTLFPAASESGAFGLLSRVLTALSSGRLSWSQIEVLGNVALFVPFGFLVAVTLARVWTGVALGVLASGTIELAQAAFLPSRVPTMLDVEHNGAGALLGAILAWPVVAAIRRSRRRRGVPGRPADREPLVSTR